MTNLYNLPKDMIIKLISTIEEETKKNVIKTFDECLKTCELEAYNCDRCNKIFSNEYNWGFGFIGNYSNPVLYNCYIFCEECYTIIRDDYEHDYYPTFTKGNELETFVNNHITDIKKFKFGFN